LTNYHELETTADLTVLKDFAHSVTTWKESSGFFFIPVPIQLMKNLPIFSILPKFIARPVILKMNPMTWYDWHIDEKRVATINSLLSGTDSKCFYGNRLTRDIVEIEELSYESDKFYLLDTTKTHAVLNLNNIRYVLSIGIRAPHSYNNVRQFCIANHL
jgi:hypothetical protein